jgi:drug/metabolite transporter (DMT)-like permease
MGALRGERPRRAELVGMVLGFAGVGVLALGSPLAGAGLEGLVVLLAPVGWALGSTIARRSSEHQRGGGLSAAATHMLAGGVWMLAASVVFGEELPSHVSAQAAAAWIYLVVPGSLVGFTASMFLLRVARPAVAMSYAYVNPIVAMLVGAVLGAEHVGWAALVSMVLIAAGVMLAVVRRTR